MMRPVLVAAWSCAMTLAGSYGGAYWMSEAAGPASPGDQPFGGISYEKVDPINVPLIIGGTVRGYIVAQFVYTAEAKILHGLAVPPAVFVVDEAFRRLYGDATIDPDHLDRTDLAGLTGAVKASVNKRLNADIIKDVLVDQFVYYSKDDMRQP